MKISIVVIHYKEDEETVSRSLEMIDVQKNFNFGELEVLFVDDGPNALKLSDEFFDSFKHLKKYSCIRRLTNTYITKRPFEKEENWTNGGPGLTRQFGIDNAKGDWITCIDCDDNFHNAYVLAMFDVMIYKTDLVFASTDWMNPQKNKGEWNYQQHKKDFTWEFGKFYKREWLKKLKITHHPELRVHEDSYFLRVLGNNTPANLYKHIDYTTYVWNHSEDSITRVNEQEYSYISFATYIRGQDLVLKNSKFKTRNELVNIVVETLIYFYYCLHNVEWYKVEAQPSKQISERMCSYYYYQWKSEFDDGWNFTVENQCVNLILQKLKEIFGTSNKIPDETFGHWFERIKQLNVKELPYYETSNIEIEKKECLIKRIKIDQKDVNLSLNDNTPGIREPPSS